MSQPLKSPTQQHKPHNIPPFPSNTELSGNFLTPYAKEYRDAFYDLTKTALTEWPQASTFVLAAHCAYFGDLTALNIVVEIAQGARRAAQEMLSIGSELKAAKQMLKLAKLLTERRETKFAYETSQSELI
jgi:hypothetical protein